MKPIVLKEGKYGGNDIKKLRKKFQPKIVDIYSEQLSELSKVKFSQVKAKRKESQQGLLPIK